MTDRPGILDTSVLIGDETTRPLRHDLLPSITYLTVITLAELQHGVYMSRTPSEIATRTATLKAAEAAGALEVTAEAAERYGYLRAQLARAKRRVNVNDLWIASVAAANNMVVVTQDGDFKIIESVGGPEVIEV